MISSVLIASLLLGQVESEAPVPDVEAAEPQPAAVGKKAPQLAGKDVASGKKFKLEQLLETSTAVVLAFLDPEHPDAGRDFNQLSKLDREWRDQEVRLVYVGLRHGARELRAFVNRRAVPWTVIPDKKGKTARQMEADGVPFVAVLDPSGIVRAVRDGVNEKRYEDLRNDLASVTGVAAPWGGTAGPRSVLLNHEHKYRFGRPPSSEGASVRWQPLAMRIGMMSRSYVSMVSATNYDEYERKLQNGEFEIANAGAILAYVVRKKYEPVVHLERRGKPTYSGILFARADSGVRKLADLKGKTLALVSEKSASGGVFPFSVLLKAGLKPEVDVKLLWAGTHGEAARAVFNGEAHAAACYDDCRDGIWTSAASRDKETQIIGRTEDIPADMIMLRRDLPAREKAALKAAILHAKSAEIVLKQISQGEALITGISPTPEGVLNPIAKVIRGVPAAMAQARKFAEERRTRELVEAENRRLGR